MDEIFNGFSALQFIKRITENMLYIHTYYASYSQILAELLSYVSYIIVCINLNSKASSLTFLA